MKNRKVAPSNAAETSSSVTLKRIEEDLKRERAAMSIEDAFDYHQYDDESGQKLEMEKAVRSAAYLLDYCSVCGNKDLNGYLALGIAKVLYFCADTLVLDRKRAGLPGHDEDENEGTADAPGK